MALSQPVTLYGIHSAMFYDRTDRKPLAYLRVLGDASLELKGETEDLMGGSQMYMWDSEAKSITSEISFTAREYPISAMSLLLAGTVTEYDAESSGEIVDIANVNGTTLHSSTGISNVTVLSGSTPKEGDYVAVGNASGKVDIYAMSDVDGQTYLNDTYKVASNLTITQSSNTDVSAIGVSLVGGSGTIDIVEGASMKFTVRRPLVTGVKMVVGTSGASFSEFGCILTGQKSGSGAITYMDVYRCKALGMPISFKEKGYSEWQITIKALYDSAKNGVFAFIRNA